MAAYAAIRIRGHRRLRTPVRDTLLSLRLTRANHCVLLPMTPDVKGQLQNAKDYITFGTVDAKQIADLIRARGRLEGDAPVTDLTVSTGTPFKSIDEFAKAISEGKARYADLKDVTPLFRLAPPKKGFKGGTKRSVQAHGSLGDRGETMSELIQRMM